MKIIAFITKRESDVIEGILEAFKPVGGLPIKGERTAKFLAG